MNLLELNKISLAALLLASMALVMLPACSSTEEAPATDTGAAPTGETPSDLEDCSVYTGQVDITECEVRNQMRQ